MAVREFTDATGRKWRAWDIRPESIHPVTRAEDYLADYLTGWIVFETIAGDEKRRLCPWPVNWMTRTEEQLCELLEMAEVVPSSRVADQKKSGVEAAKERAEGRKPSPMEMDVTDMNVVRTFRYPGGRFWSVCVVMFPEEGGPPVLRFTAGARWIDLRSWPKDWADQPDHILVDMLRRAAPRRPSGPHSPGMPRRRWDDSRDATI